MKVFAEFFKEDELQFRTRTILQFGNSWDLIGSIIMKNPGSASPYQNISENDFNHVSRNYYPNSDIQNWYEFKVDNTINRIASIFDGSYLNNKRELNGVIIIYNLFNVREKKIVDAVKKANSTNSEHLHPQLDEVLSFVKQKPTYLGFNWEYKDTLNIHQPEIEQFAISVFNQIKQTDYMYLDDKIEENYFYHPISSKIKSEQSIKTIRKFDEGLGIE